MFHFTVDDTNSTGLLTLSGDLTIHNAIELKESFSNALEQAQQLQLNLEEVEHMDLTSLQMLFSLSQTLKKQGKSLSLSGPLPQALREVVQQAGFIECGGDQATSGLWMGETN